MTRFRRALLWAFVVLSVTAAYPVWIAFQVWDQSHDDEIHGVDAIVVLGAAQYNGRPSPVYKARLDQAAFLFEEEVARRVIVTGGKQPGDRFTEAEAGESYLLDAGIPAGALLRESEGRTTWQSLGHVAELARDHGIDTVLLVSDPMHSERLKRMADDLGFDASYTSFASYERLNRSRTTKAKELLREVGSIIAYELFER